MRSRQVFLALGVAILGLSGCATQPAEQSTPGDVMRFVGLAEGEWVSEAAAGQPACDGRTISLRRFQNYRSKEIWLNSVVTQPGSRPLRRQVRLSEGDGFVHLGGRSGGFLLEPFKQFSGLTPDDPIPDDPDFHPQPAGFRPEGGCHARFSEPDGGTIELCGNGDDPGNWLSAPSVRWTADSMTTLVIDKAGRIGGCRFVRKVG